MSGDMDLLQARTDDLVREHEELLQDLIALRDRHGLSQKAIARMMGVTQPTVAAFERYDSNPTLATLRRYAAAVGARIEHRVVDDCVGDAGREFEGVTRGIGRTVWQQPESAFESTWIASGRTFAS